MASCVSNSAASGTRAGIVPRDLALLRSHLVPYVQFWAFHYRKVLEHAQRKATDLGKGLEQLRELGVFTLKKRKFRGDLIIFHNHLKRGWSWVGLKQQMTRQGEITSYCARGGLDWILGQISSWKGLSTIGIGCPGNCPESPHWRHLKMQMCKFMDRV